MLSHLPAILALFALLLLPGCAAVAVGGAIVGTTASVVGTTVSTSTKVVGGTISLAVPDGDDEDEAD